MPTIKLVTSMPGPKSQEIVSRREAAMARGVAKLTPVAIVHAEGAAITDADGNTLLDFAGGIGALAVGHCPPQVVNAIQGQVEHLIHMCAIVGTYPSMVEVAEMLNHLTPGDFDKRTVLCNSGAEAIETSIKIVRSFTKRAGIIVFEGAYHGRTNLTLSMTSKYGLFKKGFGPFAPEIYRLPFPNVYRRPAGLSEDEYIDDCIARLDNALIAQIDPEAVAAIVIEPVQGEGGFIAAPPRFLQRIRQICDQHGIVMVADEVQSGFGRTGKLFAVDHYDIVPDVIVTAKSLAAGMPLAAVTGRSDIMNAPHPGGLGGTYSGNPLACVAAIEAMKIISDPAFLARANEIGARMREHLLELQANVPLIGDVRGLGPMLLIEMVKDRTSKVPAGDEVPQIVNEAFKRGLVIIRAGLYSNCIRFLPPLNISDDQVDEGMGIVSEAVRVVAGQLQKA
ncbi:MAG: 4-aminobutyrate--2-oxoglutarate transaminase [Burkholderiales bacterium]|nr:4-aminobutyrate--2-oxoglutarate transaminase [Anaerolineae bacterium]